MVDVWQTWALGLGLLVLIGGCGGQASPPAEADPEADLAGPASSLAFTDVTDAAGLGAFAHRTGARGDKWFPETMGSGGGFLDYNGDGWPDIVLVTGGTWDPGDDEPALRLYENQGDGRFEDATEAAGLGALRGYGLGVVGGDVDNDGDEDLYLTFLEENVLLRNDDGRFVAAEAGVAGEGVWSSSALFFDADRDGDLDLYSGNYVAWSPETDLRCSVDGESKSYCTPRLYEGVPGRFYRNAGDGRFEDATEAAGFETSVGKNLGVVALDHNGDGWPDLVVANDTAPDLLFLNNGDGTFSERGVESGLAFSAMGKARAGMGIDVGVVDATEAATVFIGHFSREMIGVYRHRGSGFFVDRAARSQIGQPSLLTLAFGLFLFDADLDGDLDLFVGNGHVQEEIGTVEANVTYEQPPHLFLNEGDGTFRDALPALGGDLAQPLVARGAAYADIDLDGDLDVLVTQNGGPARLYRNDLRSEKGVASSLRLRLEGQASNRDAVGAVATVVAGDVRQTQRVAAGHSYLSFSEKPLTFGLGEAAGVDSLVVRWPSGRLDRFADLPAGARLYLVEGEPPVPDTAPPL